jgi:hypothetical protein
MSALMIRSVPNFRSGTDIRGRRLITGNRRFVFSLSGRIGPSRGVAFFRSGRVQVFRDAPDSLREEAFGMSEDKGGWLWIATSGDVLRVSKQKVSNGASSAAKVCEYGAADGLPNAKGVKRS